MVALTMRIPALKKKPVMCISQKKRLTIPYCVSCELCCSFACHHLQCVVFAVPCVVLCLWVSVFLFSM